MTNRPIFKYGVSVKGTDFMEIPYGTTAQRGNPAARNDGRAAIRVNSATSLLEWWSSNDDQWRTTGSSVSYPGIELTLSGSVEILPEKRYFISNITASANLEINPSNWKIGQKTFVGIANPDLRSFDVRFSSKGGTNVAFNTARINQVTPSSPEADYVYVRSNRMYYSIEYIGDEHFIVGYIGENDQSDTNKYNTINTVSGTNITTIPWRFNAVSTLSALPTGGQVILPNPFDCARGSKLILQDTEGGGESSAINIICPTGQLVDGVAGGPVHFLRNWEVIQFTRTDSGWDSGRTYPDVRMLLPPTNLRISDNHIKFHTPGKWVSRNIDWSFIWAQAWVSTTTLNTVKPEAAEVFIDSANKPIPGITKVASAAGRQYIKYIESGREFTRYLTAAGGSVDTHYRSTKPISAEMTDIATQHTLLDVMPSPKTTYIHKEAVDVTINLVRTSTNIHSWEIGDEVEIVNKTGSILTLSAGNVNILDENDVVIESPVVMDKKGLVVLVFTSTGFEVKYRFYY